MTSGSTTRNNLPVLLLFGPTAVGKTDLLRSCFKGSGEVISADALQVYRGFDIGTAKPDRDILDTLPHHLIDIRDPREGFSAGDFVTLADSLVPEILARGKLPILSGGTAFYLKNFLFGLPTVPPGGGELRDRLIRDTAHLSDQELHARLAESDSESARRIPPGNRVRVQRALEVFTATGRPLSSFPLPDTPRNGYRFLVIGLERNKDDLETRIRQRTGAMIAGGLIEEVKDLLAAGVPEECPAMQGIGYKEVADWLKGGNNKTEVLSDAIALHTRQYAKRQMTFFRSLPGVRWFHPDEVEKIRTITADFVPGAP